MAWPESPRTVWLTGLSGAGKSTLATGLHAALAAAGVPALLLDGDRLRQGLCSDLGFEPAARRENLRRAAQVARLANESGCTVVASFIAPLRTDRALVHDIVGPGYREVHVATPLAVCEARDPKGLYRRARSGRLPGFTGVDAPYEPPETPALRLDTVTQTPAQCVASLLQWLGG